MDARAARKPVDEVRAALDASVIAAGPAEVDLSDAGVVGIVGRREATTAVARSLLLQAAVHCGPADLTIGVFHDPGRDQEWEWTRWLPHTRRLGTGEEGRWISGRRRESDSLLSGLRDGVEALATWGRTMRVVNQITFEAKDDADAMRLAVERLGPNAVIFSTRTVRTGGVLGFFQRTVLLVTAGIIEDNAEEGRAKPRPRTKEARDDGETRRENLIVF